VTLLRPTAVIAGMTGVPSRADLSVSGIQLVGKGRVVWAKKPFWLRNPPYTVGPYAHDGQIEVRAQFGQIAHAAKGKKGLDPETGLTPAAAEVAKRMKGYKAPDRMAPEAYPSKLRRTFATLRDLEAEMAKRGIRK